MINCLIAVKLMSLTEFAYVEFPVEEMQKAQYMAALFAGTKSGNHKAMSSGFGFKCGDGQWVSVGLDHQEVFADSNKRRTTQR